MRPSSMPPALRKMRRRTPPVSEGVLCPFESLLHEKQPKIAGAPGFLRLFCALVHAGYKNPRSKVSASQRKFAAMCAVRRYAGAGCHSSWRANPFGFAAGCRRAGTACSKFRATKRCGPLCGKLPIFGIFPLFCAFLAECTLRKFPKYGIIYLQRRRENSDGKAGKSYARAL